MRDRSKPMVRSAFDKNALGKTLKDYQCKKCGRYHTNIFLRHLPFKSCSRCQTPQEGYVLAAPGFSRKVIPIE